MFALLRCFKKPPKVGDIYVFDHHKKDDPWDVTGPHKVEVLDAKSGWVKYKFCGSTFFTDERMERSSFHYCYKKQE